MNRESRIPCFPSKPNTERRLLQGKAFERLAGTVANLACPVLHIRCCLSIQRKVAHAGSVSRVAALGGRMRVMPNLESVKGRHAGRAGELTYP
jgi:hypothetical protein